MAHNGGGGGRISVPTSSAVRLAASSVPPLPPSLTERDLITLAQPRPGLARVRNEYIETPLRPQPPPTSADKGPLAGTAIGKSTWGSGRIASGTTSASLPRVHGGGPTLHLHHPHHHQVLHPHPVPNTHPALPVLTQPSVTFSKEKSAAAPGAGGLRGSGDSIDGSPTLSSHRPSSSIICGECGRCKCEACRNPRPLPSTWICGARYQCSAETTVDYLSCMCCVKASLYHCIDYEMDDVSCADRPCSCSPHRRCLRWGCLGLLTLVLPCLLCYWPLKGCLKLCQACYTKYNSPGCQCRETRETARRKVDSSRDQQTNNSLLHSKRLLDIEC